MSVVCLLDNGAGKIKAGTCKNSGSRNEIIPLEQTNCTARVIKQMNILVGDEVDKCLNGSLLHYNRPFDRGYLVNWYELLLLFAIICNYQCYCYSIKTTRKNVDTFTIMIEYPFLIIMVIMMMIIVLLLSILGNVKSISGLNFFHHTV